MESSRLLIVDDCQGHVRLIGEDDEVPGEVRIGYVTTTLNHKKRTASLKPVHTARFPGTGGGEPELVEYFKKLREDVRRYAIRHFHGYKIVVAPIFQI